MLRFYFVWHGKPVSLSLPGLRPTCHWSSLHPSLSSLCTETSSGYSYDDTEEVLVKILWTQSSVSYTLHNTRAEAEETLPTPGFVIYF